MPTRSCAVTSCVAGDPLRFSNPNQILVFRRDLDGLTELVSLGGRSLVRQLLRQGWLACVDPIPRRMLKSEEKVTRVATSQQSAGRRDAVSGEVIRNIDVGSACECVVVISLSRACRTPSLSAAGSWFQFVDVSFRRMQSSTPPQVTTSCKACKVGSAGKLLLLPAMVAPCEPCPKHDTSSKHSYTWSHCTSRVEQLRGDAVLTNSNV
jgi:hypothetical protein